MLPQYTQFTLIQAVRTPMQLLSPPLITSTEVSLPRQSVIHMLDMDTEDKYPIRTDYRISNSPPLKRVPVLHVYDLIEQNSVLAIANKAVVIDIKNWARSHLKQFKEQFFLDEPISDLQVNSVINYNLLKDRYRYATSLIASQDRRNNILHTYWSTVSKSVKKLPGYHQFVSFKIPSIVPSHTVLTAILKQEPSVYARVVTDSNLNALIHIYTYLDSATRHRSALREISLEQTEHITVELTHRGYSAFFKLSYLVGLSEENEIPSKRKIPANKLQRLFILLLLDVQTQAAMLVDKTNQLQSKDTVDDVTQEDQSATDEDEQDTLQETTAPNVNSKLVTLSPSDKTELPKFTVTELAKADVTSTLKVDDFDSVVSEAIIDDRTNTVSTFSDDIFLSAIDKFKDNKELEVEDIFSVDYSAEKALTSLSDKTTTQIYEEYITQAKTSGVSTTADIRLMKKLVDTRMTLKSPYNEKQIDQDKQISPADLIVTDEEKKITADISLVPDKYKTEVLFNTDRKYISKVMPKDILACVTNLEKANVVIKAYEVETVKAVTGFYEVHKLTLKPLSGKESTVYFRLPVINKEGEFTASGINYKMRKQRTDLPIRKIAPTKVSLTTNYGKLFVLRTEKKAYDTLENIVEQIKKKYLSQDGDIIKISSGNVYDNKRKTPNIFSVLSMHFVSIQTKDYTFVFSDKLSKEQIEPALYDLMKASESSFDKLSMFACGYTSSKEILFIKPDESIHIYKSNNQHVSVGYLEDLLSLQTEKIPKSFTNIKILGDAIPLGVVMSYYLGLKGLLAVTDTAFTVIGHSQRHTPARDETVLRFSDVKIILKTDTVDKQLLFAGFLYYKDFIKSHEFITFNDKNIYLDLLSYWDAGVIHLKELDTLRALFIDPISSEVLTSMNEPHEYLKLLLRANNMLSDLSHPDVNDLNYSRIRSYDRVPGLMYRVLSEAVRSHKLKGNGKGKIELDPYKVWNTITQDTTVKITEETNPIVDIKEVESATFSGTDGLSKGATPEKMRRFHASDKGVISEATVDSSDVGLNFFLTPTANFIDVRGRIGKKSGEQDSNFSTSALLAPMSEYDD